MKSIIIRLKREKYLKEIESTKRKLSGKNTKKKVFDSMYKSKT